MLTRLLSLLVLLAFMVGCGIKTQTYVMTKERVGIEKGSGNAGYLTGEPQYIEPAKKTRQIYVLELSKAVGESEVKKIEQETAAAPSKAATSAPAPLEQAVIPSNEDKSSATAAALSGGVAYTVQKDDTLQKIAKKHYGSYGKWVKIYQANKDKIKDPNLLKPGMVITIPPVK
ncbi:MAG: LysM peptidoglycan-binding domain-containing protein [Candidatus Omnitrophica bacterium]|nr:LysM peptidoglycan-binding domain-containing protein [Candidatus Omnitrophota bacterium]